MCYYIFPHLSRLCLPCCVRWLACSVLGSDGESRARCWAVTVTRVLGGVGQWRWLACSVLAVTVTHVLGVGQWRRLACSVLAVTVTRVLGVGQWRWLACSVLGSDGDSRARCWAVTVTRVLGVGQWRWLACSVLGSDGDSRARCWAVTVTHVLGVGQWRWARAAALLCKRFGRTLRLFTVRLIWRQTLSAAVLLKRVRVLLLRELPMVHCRDTRGEIQTQTQSDKLSEKISPTTKNI